MFKYILALFLTTTALYAENWYPVETSTPGEWFIRSVQNSRPQIEKSYLASLKKLGPYAERFNKAEKFHSSLEELFSSNRLEDAAIEKALGWKPGDYTWFNNKFYNRTGCTSWIIAPDSSFSGTCIVQKNRDYYGQNYLSVRIFRSMPERYKVITVNDLWNSGAGAVMNEKGLMIVQNDGSSEEMPQRKINVGCIFILRYIAEHCATLDEAVAMLKKFYDTGMARSNAFYLIADLDRGMIVEATCRHYSTSEVKFAFDVRSNSYLLPGMASVAKTSRSDLLNGVSRRFYATEFLRTAINAKKKVAPEDLIKLARLRKPNEENSGWRQVCYRNTLASTMFVPDRMYPQYLSVTFVALGPPRHTVFIPVPMGLSKLPESLINGQWGIRGLKLAKKLPLDHERIAEFESIEAGFIKEFLQVRESARSLLQNNKTEDAVKLLDELFARQYAQACEFMSRQAAEK